MLSVKCGSWSKSVWSVNRHTALVSFPTHRVNGGCNSVQLADLLSLPRSSSVLSVVSQLLSWLESGFYNDTCLHPFHFHLTRDVIQISLAFSDYHRLLFSADDKSPYLQGMSLACALPSGELAVVTQNLHTFVSACFRRKLVRKTRASLSLSAREISERDSRMPWDRLNFISACWNW